jgi:hypothetical protein
MEKNSDYVPGRILALLAVIFFSLTVWSNWMILDSATIEKVSGYAVTGRVSICVLFGSKLNVTLDKPHDDDVLNGTVFLNASIQQDPQYELRNVFFYRETGIIGNSTNNTILNATHRSYLRLYDTTAVQDKNCFYEFSIEVTSNSSCNPVGSSGSSRVTINNNDVEPTWNNFMNQLSTNFSALGNASRLHDFVYVTNPVLAVSNTGLLNFSGLTINFDDTDLDTYINITRNRISIFANNDNMRCLLLHNGSRYNVTFFNLSLGNPVVMRNGIECNSSCNITRYNSTQVSFYTDALDNVVFSISELSRLEIFDETDAKGGNKSKYARDQIKFFANYTNNATGQFLNASSMYCSIRFRIGNNYSNFSAMVFNTTLHLYEFNKSYSARGSYNWSVICNDSSGVYSAKVGYDSVNISNRPPYLIGPIPDQVWPQDTSLTGLDLIKYFNDSDGDSLSFTENQNQSFTPNIDVSITYDGIVIFTPHYQWTGLNFIVFEASDSLASGYSNAVTLVVQALPQMPLIAASGGGGGGGGGGGKCKPDWYCTKWSYCTPSGKRERTCIDLNNCGLSWGKPTENESCTFIPECYNSIQDQTEDGIDCGGPCPPCFTCTDGLTNCHDKLCETAADCGGPCPACVNCSDGIRNQDEIGIDCDGKCPNKDCCKNGFEDTNLGEGGVDCGGLCNATCVIKITEEKPQVIERQRNMAVLTFSFLLVLVFLLAFFKITHPFVSKYITKLMWRMSTLQKRKKFAVKKAYNARLELLESLANIESRLLTDKTSDLTTKFFNSIRKFFKDLFHLDYEYSYEELMNELSQEQMEHTTKMILASFFKKVSELNFSGGDVSVLELESLIEEARSIIDLTTEKTAEEKSTEQKSNQIKQLLLKAEGLDKIFSLIAKAQQSLLYHGSENAKQSYLRIIDEYNKLPLIKKEKVYESIKRLYDEIKLFENE